MTAIYLPTLDCVNVDILIDVASIDISIDALSDMLKTSKIKDVDDLDYCERIIVNNHDCYYVITGYPRSKPSVCILAANFFEPVISEIVTTFFSLLNIPESVLWTPLPGERQLILGVDIPT